MRAVHVAHDDWPGYRHHVSKTANNGGVQIHEKQIALDIRAEKLHLGPPPRPIVLKRYPLNRNIYVRQADDFCPRQVILDLHCQTLDMLGAILAARAENKGYSHRKMRRFPAMRRKRSSLIPSSRS